MENRCIAALPRELYRPIIQQLYRDRDTLTALCLTSVSHYREAVRVLYHQLITSDMKRQQNFLLTIARSQALADHVYEWGINPCDLIPNAKLAKLIKAGFAAMRNLKRLSFGLNYAGSTEFLKAATSRLSGLHWYCGRDAEREFMLEWLPSHLTLTAFWLRCPWFLETSAERKVAEAAPRSIVRVGGGHPTLSSLIPRSSTVTEAIWEPRNREHIEEPLLDETLLSSLKQLRKLVIAWQWRKTELLDFVIYLTSLEALEVTEYYETLDHLEPPTGKLLEHAIKNMPKLR
ncbi:hypothetical protein AX16_010327 [Volvariella volvacea WC 439]|nr:hypothetical protein AX16_010327 [Volvariella volvacea WC 439]